MNALVEATIYDNITEESGRAEVLATIRKQECDLAALRAENAELREALKSMLYLFDRELPDGSIGRIRCDEASALLEANK